MEPTLSTTCHSTNDSRCHGASHSHGYCRCHGYSHGLSTARATVPTQSQGQVLPKARSHRLARTLSLAFVLQAIRNMLLRLGAGAVFLLLLSAISFALTSLSSGDAALNTLQPMGVTSTEIIERMRASLGLDLPVIEQYLTWLHMVLVEGELGMSSHFGRAVSTVLLAASTESLKLCVLALIILVVVTLPLGIYSALKPHGLVDRSLHFISILFLSVPSFLIALLCLYFLGVRVGLVSTLKPQNLGDYLTPALCLSLPLCAYYLRQVRMAVQKELQEPYLMALTARGISMRVQLWHHVLPRTMISLLPLLGISLGHLLCGAVIIETIFSLNGLGAIALQAISYRDLYLIQAYVLYCALIFMLCNYGVNVLTKKLSRTALSEVTTC
ncbi:MAG TPA: ABC transporter permease subunit [Candidatus Anaerobiospirillum pullistercoris]|uniref:ABC transporter permease subunit n=1 Tax=Candidatus Anaerobiospirillum pullistercoris TaxID=2838452 RepID=A0A9D2AZU5_9GAMM|nr:ABC transporter permease subunit [Candidatus Anaerobiospirillum pullistercoris]